MMIARDRSSLDRLQTQECRSFGDIISKDRQTLRAQRTGRGMPGSLTDRGTQCGVEETSAVAPRSPHANLPSVSGAAPLDRIDACIDPQDRLTIEQTYCASINGDYMIAQPLKNPSFRRDLIPAPDQALRGLARSFRRISRHPALMEYRRFAALVALANVGWLVHGLQGGLWHDSAAWALAPVADAALVNLSLAILIRQQRVINALFGLAISIPVSWPLRIRREAAKVFHFGGLHVGAAVSGTLWFGLLLWAMAANRASGAALPTDRTVAITVALLVLLAAMCVTGLRPVRDRFHNLFERTHRLAGWSVLGLFWCQTISLAAEHGAPLAETPAVWLLGLLTLSVASPWLTMKRVRVAVQTPSSHVAIAELDYGATPFAGSSNAISLTPFGEYHPFASIPTSGRRGYRIAVSRAGDWTGRFIDSPPSHVWVKGITTSGVARVETLFSGVVYVATGSGIAPILGLLLRQAVPSRLIWSARSPRRTYGDALVEEIERSSRDAIIWDTERLGKPDLRALTLRAMRESGVEAAIIISNRPTTRKLVHELETEGVAAYGAIWDS